MQHRGITVRRLAEGDSLEALTALLHAAYAEHAAAGRRFFASYQSVEDTRKRVAKGECWVAFEGETMAGTVTVSVPHEPPQGYPAGPRPGTFNQLAVAPAYRGTGLGYELLCLAERRLAAQGAAEVVIDTSSLAGELIAWYERRGYAAVGRWRWGVTNYESVVLRKGLAGDSPPFGS